MREQEIIIKSIQEVKSKLHSFKPPVPLRQKVTDFTVKHLGVKDLFKVRDRFEGASYYDRLQTRVYSLAAVEKFLQIEILPKDFTNFKSDSFFSDFFTKDKGFVVRTGDFETLPHVSLQLITWIVLKKDINSYILVGSVNPEDAKNIPNAKGDSVKLKDMSLVSFKVD
jgi:hypothetical protein